MADIAIFRINYKSDFILTLVSDAGWMTPFCIKFWTGAPSQAYFVGYDGTTYTHCAPVDGDPTKLSVQFDDHHLPIGDMKFQIGYHFTVADFPTSIEDEVINQAAVIIDNDGEQQQVMLDFNGETAPEIAFAMPAYANEAQRIANEQARIAAEEQRVSNEQQRISNEEGRISAEESRQEHEQQRIHNEETRIAEFASLKADAIEATGAANDAATLANEKAQLAADKAALAQAASTLANDKAQLAADKAALAQAAATLANDKAALAQQKADYAQAKAEYAQAQGDYAKAQSDIALADHERAETDHERAEADHDTATDDHTTATSDHTQAESDHTRAEADHTTAASDHTQASSDHDRAESDHTQAGQDHTRAESDHTTAAADHTRAESDHAAVEAYVDSLGAFDISAYHATGSVLAKYADLTAALGTNGANIPDELRKGGMSVKFVLSSDNNYVQYFLTKNEWSVSEADWEKINLEEEVAALTEEVFGGTTETPLTLTETEGLIRPNGTITIASGIWSFSQDISLNKGDTIKLTAYGTIQAAAISIKSNNTYTMPSGCTWDSASKAQKSFSYTATEDCVVVLCYRNADNPRTASIVSTTEGLIDQVEEKVDDIATADGKTYARQKGLWVEITPISVDDTLTQSGEAADAKVVGGILNGEPAEAEFHSIEIPIIEDYLIDNTGAELESTYYSRTQKYLLNAGDTIRINGAGIASASAISKANDDGTFTPVVLYEGISASQQQKDYQATEKCYVTLCFRNPPTWTHAFSIKLAATTGLVEDVSNLKEEVSDLTEETIKKTIIEVGSGKTYTSLIDAIESITDSSKNNQYKIHLFAGTYETIDTSLIVEGGDYKGLVIPDYVSIKGIGDRSSIIISGSIDAATAGEYTSATINKISAINMMLNGNLENVTLYAKNVRYCNHNDGNNTVFVKQVFKDVAFVYDVLEITGVAANCNGIGNECCKDILFDHCVFDNKSNSGGGVFMHDNASASEKQGARLEIKNCIFKGSGIALSNSGGSYECYAILTGNRFVSDMLVTSANNTITTNRWKVIASSNLDFGYTKSSGMSEVDLSGDITAFCNEQSA